MLLQGIHGNNFFKFNMKSFHYLTACMSTVIDNFVLNAVIGKTFIFVVWLFSIFREKKTLRETCLKNATSKNAILGNKLICIFRKVLSSLYFHVIRPPFLSGQISDDLIKGGLLYCSLILLYQTSEK